MEIPSLEERAYQYANKLRNVAYCPPHGFGTGDYEPEECMSDEEYTYALDGYIIGATEQDNITRQEERERCIKLAQDVHCKMCELEDYCKIHGGEEDFECDSRDRIRKAIEEGGKI